MNFNDNTADLGLTVKHALTSINPADMVSGVVNNLDRYLDASAAPSIGAPALNAQPAI